MKYYKNVSDSDKSYWAILSYGMPVQDGSNFWVSARITERAECGTRSRQYGGFRFPLLRKFYVRTGANLTGLTRA